MENKHILVEISYVKSRKRFIACTNLNGHEYFGEAPTPEEALGGLLKNEYLLKDENIPNIKALWVPQK